MKGGPVTIVALATMVNCSFGGNAGGDAVDETEPDAAANTATADAAVDAADPDAPAVEPFVMRINIGGPAVTGTDAANLGDWDADDQGLCSGSLPSAGPTGPVNNTTDDDLYRFFRFQTVMCDIPIENGTYEVRLLLAEVYRNGCVSSTTVRDMGIEIEGVLRDSFDLIVETGGCAGDPGQAGAAPFDRTFTVDVADGELNAGGVPGNDNALVGAIEIIQQLP